MRLRSIATGLTLLGALAVSTFAGQQPALAKKGHGAICPRIFLPVCGLKTDGTRQTFPNACVARGAHARILNKGECSGQICTFIFLPVCARPPEGGQRTYPNACVAENANAVFLHKGECK